MGDVVGHGLAAAVVMGRLRSALRAYALDIEHPADVLDKLDREAKHFEYGTLATVSYAVVNAARDRVTLALAGHLPPVLAAPGMAPVLMTRPVGRPIGFPRTGPYPSSVLDLPAGALLCFYTDGLVERRDSTIDSGLAQLCHAVTTGAPEAVCGRVMAELVGTRAARDDIAVLMLRRE
jgi:serine phosphatase RsbU (regulator of sigma subunit)